MVVFAAILDHKKQLQSVDSDLRILRHHALYTKKVSTAATTSTSTQQPQARANRQ
jgi:hypothetical protein